jgi:hypothetical protein
MEAWRDGEIPIQSDVPIPPPGNKLYPWAKMEVGDSFAVPLSFGDRVKSAAWYYGKKHGVKFRTAQVIEGDSLVVRIWRIE